MSYTLNLNLCRFACVFPTFSLLARRRRRRRRRSPKKEIGTGRKLLDSSLEAVKFLSVSFLTVSFPARDSHPKRGEKREKQDKETKRAAFESGSLEKICRKRAHESA